MTDNVEEMNLNDVAVSEVDDNENSMTDLQLYGINAVTIRLLSKLRQYIVLTQLQIDLVEKSHSIQPVMRELYQYEETKAIMGIREELDMYRVFSNDKILVKNIVSIREKFEHAIGFVTGNMQPIESVFDKGYIQILDTFADKLQNIATILTKKSILGDNFN